MTTETMVIQKKASDHVLVSVIAKTIVNTIITTSIEILHTMRVVKLVLKITRDTFF